MAEATSELFKENVVLRFLSDSENAAINKRKFQVEAKHLLTICHENIVKCFVVILEKPVFILERLLLFF